MAFKLETGTHGAEPDFSRKHSFAARNQVGIWRGVSVVLVLVIAGLLAKIFDPAQVDPLIAPLIAIVQKMLNK